MNTQELKERIQKLINYSDKLGDRSKNLNKLLYQQLSEVDELDREVKKTRRKIFRSLFAVKKHQKS